MNEDISGLSVNDELDESFLSNNFLENINENHEGFFDYHNYLTKIELENSQSQKMQVKNVEKEN
jgi:hypothetical protein